MAPLDPTTLVQLSVGLDEPDDPAALRARVARKLGLPEAEVPEVVVRRRAIDARGGRVRFELSLGFRTGGEAPLGGDPVREVGPGPPVVIVGMGPAGLFCAYGLARLGIPSVLCDRGKPVQPRRRDLQGLTRRGVVDPDSNYCFGEGGAGTYSDGKLYTRATKRGDVRDVLEVLVLHGAPPDILVDARPHIGSNRLPKVVTALRERLEAVGVRFLFEARVEELLRSSAAPRRVAGVRLVTGRELEARAVVLATGHSARDVHALLARHGVALEAKAFAVGARIEHAQPLIDRAQYRRAAGHPKLPAAYYRLAAEVDGRGVFSFCMCPGGWIVPAATEPGGLVVNGMSLSRRDSPFANSGLVVAVEPADVEAAGFRGALGGVELQARLEAVAFSAGGGELRAPATRVADFVAGRGSTTVPRSSYVPGVTAGDLGAVLDAAGLSLADRLRRALRVFDRQIRGFASAEALLVGLESRTSSPVRVPRDPASLTTAALDGLYPCGEGAGYAGGIVSAALDGLAVARAIGRTRVAP